MKLHSMLTSLSDTQKEQVEREQTELMCATTEEEVDSQEFVEEEPGDRKKDMDNVNAIITSLRDYAFDGVSSSCNSILEKTLATPPIPHTTATSEKSSVSNLNLSLGNTSPAAKNDSSLHDSNS